MNPAIFVHVPKTAGSTLRTLITTNYAPHEVLSLYGDDKKLLMEAAAHIGKLAPYQLIQGHIPYGVHRLLGLRSARYFTFLRDPISRFLSDIAMGGRDPEHGFHHILAAPQVYRDDRMRNALAITYYNNNMVHFLSGSFCTELISMPLLNEAIDNLWNCEFVGLAEDFDVSLLIMAKKLGWRQIVPQKSNVRPDQEAPLSPETRALLERELAYDCALYAVAQEHLAQSKKQHGPLLLEAAAQLAELIRAQDTEHPQAQRSMYLVGQAIEVPLEKYNARITPGSPLARWLDT